MIDQNTEQAFFVHSTVRTREHTHVYDALLEKQNKIIRLSSLPQDFYTTLNVADHVRETMGTYGLVLTVRDSKDARVAPSYSPSMATELVEGDIALHILDPRQVKSFGNEVTRKISSIAVLGCKVNASNRSLDILQLQGTQSDKSPYPIPPFSPPVALVYAAEELVPLLQQKTPIEQVRIHASWSVESLHSVPEGQTSKTYEGVARKLGYMMTERDVSPFDGWHVKPVSTLLHRGNLF